MHPTPTEIAELNAVINICVGAGIGFGIKYFTDKTAAKKATASQLRKDVNEFVAACAAVQGTLATLR